MKHRLLYYLYHNEMPDEIDHIDRNRQNNAITNLQNVCRKQQLQNLTKGIKRKAHSIPVKTIHNICKELLTNKNYTQIANKYGCSRCYVRDIATKRRQIKISSQYF